MSVKVCFILKLFTSLLWSECMDVSFNCCWFAKKLKKAQNRLRLWGQTCSISVELLHNLSLQCLVVRPAEPPPCSQTFTSPQASRVSYSDRNRTACVSLPPPPPPALSHPLLLVFLIINKTNMCERRKETGRNTRPCVSRLLISIMWEKLQTERFTCPKHWRRHVFPSSWWMKRAFLRSHL